MHSMQWELLNYHHKIINMNIHALWGTYDGKKAYTYSPY